MIDKNKLAAIQYNGIPGFTSHCLNAIARLIHFGDRINAAKLLSCVTPHSGTHCFLIDTNHNDLIAIKSGFSSGYLGEGCSGLSKALQLLSRHGIDIDEYNVTSDFIDRLDHSCLLDDDLNYIQSTQPVRPNRWYDYILDYNGLSLYDNNDLSGVLPTVIPFQIIDSRILDLALNFQKDPDAAIYSAYRRLEDIVRERAELKHESGSKLFSKAFCGNNSILYWGDIDGGEHSGKGNLFTSVFNANRNRRAHREIESSPSELLREFLLINELYLTEQQALPRPDNSNEAPVS